ncbi:transcription factor VBP [Zootermopsis nevadensis]|uniref:D site-binding protein n=1 Tax=Zootermopsis nevadensis TaxID=136037 RepID=A0A067RX19_ZOONE|nr:transcription factor VBP [Zootermopsis nevadensis]KDR24444.1 D site-binding protein [Zootermopsis nevadensis]
MGTHVHCNSAMSAFSALHLLRSYNHFLGPAADVGHPYNQLLSPRLSDLSPASHNTDSPSAGGISPIALAPPAAAFMASPSLLGAFQPYSPLLPMMADSKTNPILTRALTGVSTCGNGKRPRGEKKPIPDDQKDEKYYERRKRNNQAAKKSRDARKIREDQIAFRATMLEHENALLRAQVITLKEEAQSLRHLLLQGKTEEATHHQQRPT